MKKQYTINILNIVLVVILIVSASFAWITDQQVQYGRWVELRYDNDNLFVMAHDIKASLFVKVRDNAANDDDNYQDYSGKDAPIFTTHEFAPGSYLQYRLDITSSSKMDTSIRIVFAGITTNSTEIAEKLVFGTTKYSGYWGTEKLPNHVVTTVSDKLNGNSFVFFENLTLPPMYETIRYFSIYWYVFFDRTATNESAVKYFNIPHIYLLSI